MKRLITRGVYNHHCKRICYFAIEDDYDVRGKSIEEIYAASHMGSFNAKEVSKYCIKHNLEERKKEQEERK